MSLKYLAHALVSAAALLAFHSASASVVWPPNPPPVGPPVPSFMDLARAVSDWALPQAWYGIDPYTVCKFDDLELTGTVTSAAAGARQHLSGSGTGACAVDPVAGPWTPVTLSFVGTGNANALPCSTDPNTNEYDLSGTFTVNDGSTNGPTDLPSTLQLKLGPIVAKRRTVLASFAFNSLSASDTFVWEVNYTRTPEINVTDANATVPSVQAGGPADGLACFRPSISEVRMSGVVEATVNSRNRDTAAGQVPISTYPEDAVDYVGPGTRIDELEGATLLEALEALAFVPDFDFGGIALPPDPVYTIEVKTKFSPTGTPHTTTYQAVFGVPSTILVPNYNNNNVTVPVTVTLGQDASNPTGYQFKIQQVLSGCSYPDLAANIKAIGSVGTIAGPVQQRYELGFEAIGLGASVDGAPATFQATYVKDSADTTAINVKAVPNCTAKPVNLVGHFSDPAGQKDLGLSVKEAAAVSNVDFSEGTDENGRKQVIYRATGAIKEIALSGTFQNKPLNVSIANIPENLDICTQDGNGCNSPWRTDRGSERSIQFDSHDATGHLSPVTVTLYEDTVDTSDPSKDKVTDARNVIFAHLGIDFKLPSSIWHAINPFTSKGYPYWFYVDTRGQAITGDIHVDDKSQGQTTRHFDIVSPAPGFWAWGREVVFHKKAGFIYMDDYGEMKCQSGMTVRFSGAPSWLENTAFETLMCNR